MKGRNRMEPKKSAFSYFVIILYLIGILYILVGGISNLGAGQEYPYLLQGTYFVLLLSTWLLLNAGTSLAARMELEDKIRNRKRLFLVIEGFFVIMVLIAAGYLRWRYVQDMPMEPESDYKTYYEVADLLKRGLLTQEGKGYCEYISMFPHVFGYPSVLSVVFRIFGTSVAAAQNFNILLAVATVFLVYCCGRLIGGKLAGVISLLLSAFWPSQILYINMVASEYLFSFLLMLCVYLFLVTLQRTSADMKHPALFLLLHMLLGILLAFCATIRPMAMLLLITIFLCVFFQKMYIPKKKPIDQPISLVILSKGWMRCVIILVCYLCVSKICTARIEYIVDENLASGSASFGYNLLVGLNIGAEGGWNQGDADYLYSALDRSGDATEAQLACRDLAMMRLDSGFESIFNLFLHKYEVLWANDDYGSTWNILFMDQHGDLTPEREQFLYKTRDMNNVFYLLVVSFAGICGMYLWKKGIGQEYVLILLFAGTVGMHLLVENQNRYHYHALFLFALLAGCSVKEIYKMNRSKVLSIREEKERIERMKLEDKARLERELAEDEKQKELRKAAMRSQFDMKDALEKGLIKVSVGKIYEKDEETEEY